ncbi:MAG: DUF2922 domain-containing protein, partial [Peptostreptococcaceae bacterium]
MGEVEIRLLMTFATNTGKKISLSVSNPREDLTEAEIKSAMDIIISKNIFEPNGEELKTAVEAKIVQTATTE